MTANNSKSQLVKQPKKAVSSPWTQPNPNFKFGEPMLTEAALESAGPSCVTLHKYYMRLCAEKKKSGIIVLFKRCHFLRSSDKECLLVNLSDLYDLFNLDTLDTSLVRCFSLSLVQKIQQQSLPVGILDPLMMSVAVMKYSREEAADYLARAISRFARREYIMFAHNPVSPTAAW
ncbi:hypothetical protein PVAP13_8KG111607 [Panicum virgatum]|uniref:Uncharacterized protein n=1 Tax=Panicum virgatum TaxID=38727 RepID=A0A8T0PGX0_PANVG|nr:hypothetical protein PVAP13_8KG111607 [Panicum virgatum]